MSESLLDIFADTKIKPSYKSDHCLIELEIYTSKTKKGRGIWKINNSLLMDESLFLLKNEEIILTVSVYACTPYNPDFFKKYTSENIELMIDIDLFWEVLHAQLRGLIFTYATRKKRLQNNREIQLNNEIEIATKEINSHIEDRAWNDTLKMKQEELEELREHKLRGALIRARWQQLTEGEKPS